MRRGWSPERDRRVLFGEVPWGYRLSEDRTKLVTDHGERRITSVVLHMRANGSSIRQIVKELERMGIVGRRGTAIGVTRVFEMLHGGRKATGRRAAKRGKRQGAQPRA